MSVDRRSVLGMLAVSGVLLSSFMRKALGQSEPDTPLSLPGASGEQAQSLGLPSDWRFVAPAEWNTVDATLTARLNPALRDNSPIELGGIKVMRSSGKIETGQLDPVGQSVEFLRRLPASSSRPTRPSASKHSTATLIRSWPIRAGPTGRPCSGRCRQAARSMRARPFCRCASSSPRWPSSPLCRRPRSSH